VKKSITVIAVFLLFALVAAAQQDVPRYEAFLGYTYVRANSFNQNTGLGQSVGGFDMNGGSGQFIYNFNKWVSGVGDFGAVYKPNVGIVNVKNTTAFTLFGPRTYFRWRRLSPYAQVLIGAAYRSISTGVNGVTDLDAPILDVANPANLFPGPDAEVSARLATTQTAFALEAGGGLDYRVGKHFSFRLLEADYVLTRFPSLSSGYRANQSNIKASTGFIFTFGEQ
jgi:Outer membrane protein beta-barrel domain